MTWFKVDDTLAFHRKTVAAGVAAMGLWVRAGSWSAQTLTDGFVPEHMVPPLADGDAGLAGRLVEAGLWRRVRGGYSFHEWAERQPSRQSIEDRRAVRAEAGRKGGVRSGQVRGTNGSKPEASASSKPEASASRSLEPPSRPGPTRPEEDQKHALTPLADHPDPPGESDLFGDRTPAPTPEGVVPIRRKADETFARFWGRYPRKKSKQEARKAWDNAIKKADPERLIEAAGRLADSKPDLKYTLYPATWLNRGSWEDEPDPVRAASGDGYRGWHGPADQSEYDLEF